jgi:hypothetical protein
MRTKTLLLTAALVAAGVASSMAQSNVYSLNIVGYYNVPVNGSLTAVANSLNNGTPANRADQVIPYSDGDNIQVWSGVSWDIYTMDSGAGTGWADVNSSDVQLVDLPTLSPGKGFFYGRAGSLTNITFVGEVPTGTNTVNITLSLNALGSPLPYGGAIETGPIGLPIADGDNVQLWNGVQWVLNTRDSGAGTGWADVNSSDVPEPTLSVGQGFFYGKAGGNITWTQILNP